MKASFNTDDKHRKVLDITVTHGSVGFGIAGDEDAYFSCWFTYKEAKAIVAALSSQIYGGEEVNE